MHHSINKHIEDVQILMENRYLLYLIFCSKCFELEKKLKGDRFFTYSPVGHYRVYDYHYAQWDHWGVIRCDSLAAERLLSLRNNYSFPDEEQITKELNSCRDYPESDAALYPEFAE